MEGRERFTAQAEETKRLLAPLLGCQADDLGFPHSVAQAVNMVVGSLNLKAGENVVFLHTGGAVGLYGYMHAFQGALAA